MKEVMKLPARIAEKLIEKVDTYLARDPKRLGKPLTGQFSGLYRYRFGDYRIIYEIHQKELHIYIVAIGHRKNIYD